MQQVKLKKGSMEAARHGNDQAYYLFEITDDTNGKYAVIKYINVNRWCTLTVNRIALEVAVPAVMLASTPILNVPPVDIPPEHIEGLSRAFWRRIEPYKNDYGKELPAELPKEFRAHMTTALMVLEQ